MKRTTIKDIITDLFGLAIMLGVGYNTAITHKVPFIWEGLAGICVGAVFFLVSDNGIVGILTGLAKKGTDVVGKKDDAKPDQPDVV